VACRGPSAPSLATGGITSVLARPSATAGAAGVAAISLFIPTAPGGIGPREAIRRLGAAFNAD